MLEVADLRAGYGGTEILRGVTLNVDDGEIVAVLGANGVGKTTLNATLSGLVKARAGSVRFAGEDVTGRAPHEIVARGLIHVPEGRKIFPNLTVRENLDLGSYLRGKANRAESREKVLARFPRLRERAAQRAGTLSGGEQQMLAIGRGLMAQPRLIILDEPSLGLSPLLVEDMFALIVDIAREGVAVLLVEQNAAQSLEIAKRAYVMENGAITISGHARDLANDPELQKAYLGV